VILVCAAPLYSEVALTAGLRGVLSAAPQNAEITLQATGTVLSPETVAQETQSVNRLMQQQLGAYLQGKPDFFITTPQLGVTAPAFDVGDSITLTGASMPQAARHLKVLSGRLPQPLSNTLEIAITQSTAGYMHVSVGTTLGVGPLFFFNPENGVYVKVPARIVGIIATPPGDPYWHDQDFNPPIKGPSLAPPTNFEALMSNDTFLAVLEQIAVNLQVPNSLPFEDGEQPTLYWYYHLNTAQLGINQLDDLIGQLRTTQAQIESGNIPGPLSGSNDFSQTHLSGPALPSPQSSSILERFQARVSVVTIPVAIVLLQVLGLLLFFVGLMARLLVERQAEVITLLRSRGASRRHIFGAFFTQSAGLALLALLAGPLLAILVARALIQHTLAPADQQALNVIAGNPVPVALSVGWDALAAALGAVLALLLAIRGAASQNVLDLRREAARATRRPLWQRVYLDGMASVIALTGFLLSLYITHSGVVDAQTHLLIAAPLALVAPLFLVIAGLLLFLRGFPLFLRLIARFARRRAGAAAMLALAQMARAPRQAIRMILLLALASSFASFALVFTASEAQHIQQIAAYEAGADFSGQLLSVNEVDPLAKQTAAYRKIPGVISASLGYAGDASLTQSAQGTPFSIRAVDTSTFAQTAIWTDQDSSQPLASLLAHLRAARQPTGPGQAVPAIVDALTWQTLHLSVGAPITTQFQNKTITFLAIAEVDHIPTVNDSLVVGTAPNFTPTGGLLVDYHALTSAYNSPSGDDLFVNYVWLRTSDSPALLAQTRAALSAGPLALLSINDRRAMLAALEQDPLSLALNAVLLLGTIATLLLALVGNLTASWLHVRARLINFALLRALGSAPRQIASVLTWEQVLVYATALALGAAFGALLAFTIVPALVFTGVPSYSSTISSGEFFTLQHVLPIAVVLPLALVMIFVALVGICVGAIGMMAYVASRPSISQTLRLNED
jgi:ABC-type lipoprotein release transport system permease subunit